MIRNENYERSENEGWLLGCDPTELLVQFSPNHYSLRYRLYGTMMILAIIRRYSDIIIASFSGHAHKGGYTRDEVSGVHFRTFEAVLESPENIRTYAIVDLHEDRIVVRACRQGREGWTGYYYLWHDQ